MELNLPEKTKKYIGTLLKTDTLNYTQNKVKIVYFNETGFSFLIFYSETSIKLQYWPKKPKHYFKE